MSNNAYKIDFGVASSDQIERALCERLERIRLARNLTQKRLAQEAGVSLRTVSRLAAGDGITLDTLIRVMTALGIQGNLAALLPDPAVRPIERVREGGRERRRASSRGAEAAESVAWTWADDPQGGADDQ